MKKTLAIVLTIALIVMQLTFITVITASAATLAAPNKLPTIDGVINDGEWDASSYFKLDKSNATVWVGAIDDKDVSEFYFAWGNKGLYVGVKVQNVSNPVEVKNPDSWLTGNSDCVQIAVNPGQLIKNGTQGLFFDIGARADGGVYVFRNVHGGQAIKVEGKSVGHVAGSTTYTLEVIIPWSAFQLKTEDIDTTSFKPVPGAKMDVLFTSIDMRSSSTIRVAYKSSAGKDDFVKFDSVITFDKYADETAPTVVVSPTATSTAPAQDIKVIYQGKQVDFSGTKPMIKNGSTLVPLRAIFEAMGATVDYANGNITAKKGDTIVKLTVGKTTATVNGKSVTLSVPSQIINGSTLVPLRFIGEAFGNKVDWDAKTLTVTIS